MDEIAEQALVERLMSRATDSLKAAIFGNMGLLLKLSAFRDAARSWIQGDPTTDLENARNAIVEDASHVLEASDQAVLRRILDEAVKSVTAAR